MNRYSYKRVYVYRTRVRVPRNFCKVSTQQLGQFTNCMPIGVARTLFLTSLCEPRCETPTALMYDPPRIYQSTTREEFKCKSRPRPCQVIRPIRWVYTYSCSEDPPLNFPRCAIQHRPLRNLRIHGVLRTSTRTTSSDSYMTSRDQIGSCDMTETFWQSRWELLLLSWSPWKSIWQAICHISSSFIVITVYL